MSIISLSFLYLVLLYCVEALEVHSTTNYAPQKQRQAATSFPRLLIELDTHAAAPLLSPPPPPPPRPRPRPPPPITHHPQLPKTYLIILVLSFIAILTICLCSFIWPTNDERAIADPGHEASDDTAALHAAVLVQDIIRPGLDDAVVNKLPTLLFTTQRSRLPREVRKLESYMCAVCISDFEEGETLKLLPACGHAFHKDCIDMWLFSHQTCPLCRLCLLDNKGDVILLEIDEEVDDVSDTQRGGADGVDDDIVAGDSACRLSPLMKMFRRTQSSIDRAAGQLGRATKIHPSHSFS